MNETPDDTTLALRIAAAPQGDREAEAELCRRLAPRVRLYGLRHLRDPHAAADLVQEVLLITLTSLRGGKLRDASQLVSFVFGTCRTMVLDQRRTQQRRDALLEWFGPDLVPPTGELPQLDEARLRRCLERLSARERSVVVLSFYDDRPAREVASGLGMTEGNVRVVRHRAIQRLRGCMTGHDA